MRERLLEPERNKGRRVGEIKGKGGQRKRQREELNREKERKIQRAESENREGER